MSRVVPHTDSLAVNPSSYDSDHSYYSISSASSAYASETSTSYSSIGLTRGSQAVTYIYFKFNTSAIPANATITSVSCKAKAYSNANNTYAPTKQICMYSGTTAKGSSQNLTTSEKTFTFSGTTWTRQELNDARIRLYAVRGTSNVNTSRALYFYGATLTVNYSYNENFYTVTASSSTSGVTVSPASQEYAEGDDATITISGASLSGLSVTDNSVDVSSSVSISGSDLVYTIVGLSADHTIIVVYSPPVGGQEIFVKQNGSWVAVDTVYVKQNGAWKEVETLSIKQNGSWVN